MARSQTPSYTILEAQPEYIEFKKYYSLTMFRDGS